MAPVSKKAKKIHAKDNGNNEGISVVSAQLKKQIENKKKIVVEKPKRGVVFVKHLPHGFFEKQLKEYFKQFGKITNLRLVRSRRTGNSKSYAFIEFEVPEVAKIAAETMDNYLMFQKLVKAAYIPPEEQQYNYFKTSVRRVKNPVGKTIYVSRKTKAINKRMKNLNNWTEENYEKRTRSGISKLNALKKRYENLGIDFDKLVVKPTLVPPISRDNKDVEDCEEDKNKENVKGKKPGSLLLRKRKSSSEEELDVSPKSKELEGKLSKQPCLDETFSKDFSDSEDYAIKNPKQNMETQLHFTDKYEKIIRRKPHFGAIQKASKKHLKANVLNKKEVKHSMKTAIAKEILKSENVQYVKGKDLKRNKRKQ